MGTTVALGADRLTTTVTSVIDRDSSASLVKSSPKRGIASGDHDDPSGAVSSNAKKLCGGVNGAS